MRDDALDLSEAGLKAHCKRRRSKYLNENLAPLRRYLERQVGRPWDDVWSEICENLKPSSTVQQHVRDHIPDFVAIKTALRDGEVWVHDRWGWCVRLSDARAKLYVDPQTGILCRNEHWRSWALRRKAQREAREKERTGHLRIVSPSKQFHLFDGDWWEVTVEPIRPVSTRWKTNDAKFGGVLIVDRQVDVVRQSRFGAQLPTDLYGRDGLCAVAKRQLSKREMRALGLPRPH
ncbi:MAG: hypothetical protein GC190_14490 [Alphaproteobacteria bacterium]|nr:hypothetical protein [Alphaproteobacteria bacterium]